MDIDVTDRKAVETAFVELNKETKALREKNELGETEVKRLAAQVSDVQRLINEQTHKPPTETLGNDEREINKRYLRADGSIRMVQETIKYPFAGELVEVDVPGLLDDKERCCELQREIQTAYSRRNMARLVMRKGVRTEKLDGQFVSKLMRLPKDARDAADAAIKPHARAFFGGITGGSRSFNDSSNEGAEWISDGFIPDVYRAFEYPSGHSAQHESVNVSNDTWARPKMTTSVRPYLLSKITDDNPADYTASSPVTDTSSMTAVGLAVRVLIDAVSAEDSAIAVLPYIQSLLIEAYADGYEDCRINGDSTATHQDAIASWNTRSRWGASGLGGSADHRRGFIGLRARAVDVSNTTDRTAAQTVAGHLSDMSTLGERGVGDLLVEVSPEYMVQKMMGFSEVLTMEKFGANATIMRGALAMLLGQPVFINRWITADLASTGLYTGSGSTSGKLITDRKAFMNYVRRGPVVESKKEISSQHFELVLTGRRLFSTPDASSTKNVHWAYNLL